MAFDYERVKDENKTGFTFRGQEIVLSKTRGRPLGGKHKPGWYPDDKRIEVATLYAVLGNTVRVEELTDVPRATIRYWRKEQWFVDLMEEIRVENDDAIDAKFTDLIEKSLEQLGDRLENGDYVVLRDGTTVRKPVGARDLASVQSSNIDKRQLLRGKPTSRSESVSSEDRLAKLAEQFAALANKRVTPVLIEAEVTRIEDQPVGDQPNPPV